MVCHLLPFAKVGQYCRNVSHCNGMEFRWCTAGFTSGGSREGGGRNNGAQPKQYSTLFL